MNLKILAASADPEEILFLQEVLEDIQSGRHWRGWVHIESAHAMSIDDAIDILADETIDAVLLDLAMCGERPIDVLQALQAAAPRTPVIIIAEPGDAEIAGRLVREGAQDFLLADQIDTGPLAHALGNAIERHRLVAAAGAARTEDAVTGLLNRTAFLTFAERDRKLAENLGCRWMIVMVEPSEGSFSMQDPPERRDLVAIETAEWLRKTAGPTDLMARVGGMRFALGIFDTAGEPVRATWSRLHNAARDHQISIGAAIFDWAHPAPLEGLMEQAEQDLTPRTMAMRT